MAGINNKINVKPCAIAIGFITPQNLFLKYAKLLFIFYIQKNNMSMYFTNIFSLFTFKRLHTAADIGGKTADKFRDIICGT